MKPTLTKQRLLELIREEIHTELEEGKWEDLKKWGGEKVAGAKQAVSDAWKDVSGPKPDTEGGYVTPGGSSGAYAADPKSAPVRPKEITHQKDDSAGRWKKGDLTSRGKPSAAAPYNSPYNFAKRAQAPLSDPQLMDMDTKAMMQWGGAGYKLSGNERKEANSKMNQERTADYNKKLAAEGRPPVTPEELFKSEMFAMDVHNPDMKGKEAPAWQRKGGGRFLKSVDPADIPDDYRFKRGYRPTGAGAGTTTRQDAIDMEDYEASWNPKQLRKQLRKMDTNTLIRSLFGKQGLDRITAGGQDLAGWGRDISQRRGEGGMQSREYDPAWSVAYQHLQDRLSGGGAGSGGERMPGKRQPGRRAAWSPTLPDEPKTATIAKKRKREPAQQQESLELNEEITRWHKLAGLRDQ